MVYDKEEMFRLPWNHNDNPIGWVEVTDICNIHCKGCYRSKLEGHKDLETIKMEVLFHKKWRNIDNVSLAGGEPLVHPQILDIVAFIREQGIKPIILSNAHALDPHLLKELRKAGLTGFTLHIDSLQNRPDWKGKNEKEINELRQHYADMVSKEKLYLAFNSTVYSETLPYVPDMVRWARDNIDKVHSIIFITFRGVPKSEEADYTVDGEKVDEEELSYTTEELEGIHIKSEDVWSLIKEHFPEYEPGGYLGGTQSHESVKWLTASSVGGRGRVYGCLGPKTMEIVQSVHHLWCGTYVAYLYKPKVTKLLFLLSPFDKVLRKTFVSFLRAASVNPLRWFRPLYPQSIGIIQAPDVMPDGTADMCDSCPDITYFEGKFVNSCRLDEYRKFGKFLHREVKEKVIAEENPPFRR
jgi:organic radical activating enzyme